MLDRAGLPLEAPEFAHLVAIATLAGLVLSGLLGGPLAYGLVGLVGPFLFLLVQVRSRRQALEAQVPRTVALYFFLVGSGIGGMRALEALARSIPAPMGLELCRLLEESTLGCRPEEALSNLRIRWALPSMHRMVEILLIQRDQGGGFVDCLRTAIPTSPPGPA